MTRAVAVDDIGDGPAVLLVHAGVFSGWFTPLAAEPALAGRRVLRMVRAGYGDTPEPAEHVRIADHAADCAALLRDRGAAPALVVAHSSGSVIALQLAIDHPDVVSGLVLSEPPLVDALLDPADVADVRATIGPVIGQAMAARAAGDDAGAYDAFMGAVCGPAHREVVAAALGADALAERECRYFLRDEAGAAGTWSVDDDALARIDVPVLLVAGGDSPPPTHRLVTRLAARLPKAEVATIEGDNHLLPLRSPGPLAALVAQRS